MNGVYFDWQILGCERLTKEERRLRERLQRNRTAHETLCAPDKGRGLRREREEIRRPAFTR